MNDLKCKYCGQKFMGGVSCQRSPIKKHIAFQNSKNCVYCGQIFVVGVSCQRSPTKKHRLEE